MVHSLRGPFRLGGHSSRSRRWTGHTSSQPESRTRTGSEGCLEIWISPPCPPTRSLLLQQGPTSYEFHNLPKQRHLLGPSACAPVGLVSHSNHSSRYCSAILAGGYLKVALGHLPFLHLLNTFSLLGFLLRTEKTKTGETMAGPNHSWCQGPKQKVVLVSEARWWYWKQVRERITNWECVGRMQSAFLKQTWICLSVLQLLIYAINNGVPWNALRSFGARKLRVNVSLCCFPYYPQPCMALGLIVIEGARNSWSSEKCTARRAE